MSIAALYRAHFAKTLISALLVTLTAPPTWAGTALADAPVFSSITAPANVLLAMSVEFPTALAPAYLYNTPYTSTQTFLGYFDPDKCYTYNYNSTTPSLSYFPTSVSSGRTCSGTWSGNYMNWASMHTLDAFRSVMTGGNRSVDTSTQTILTKTFSSTQGGGRNNPDKTLASGAAAVTPLGWAYVTTSTAGRGIQMLFTKDKTTTTNSIDPNSGWDNGASWGYGCMAGQKCIPRFNNANYSGDPYYPWWNAWTNTDPSVDPLPEWPISDWNNSVTLDANTIYRVYINVEVCKSSPGLESNCTVYSAAGKPEGLVQKYASTLKFSAFSYLDIWSSDPGNVLKDGGIMRAPMKWVGPTQPVPGSTAITNSAREWDATTGIFLSDPDGQAGAHTVQGFSVNTGYSGVVNYLNRFGYKTYSSGSAYQYKDHDPVSELYYAALRYYKNLGNVASYSSLSNATDSAMADRWLDGFPMYTTWSDPVQYSCQKNFILGIGDANTGRDTNLPGSNRYSADAGGGYEPAVPSEVSADTTVNVTTATNMVGQLEGVSNLSLGNIGCCSGSFYMAGLAYDAHTRDIRSDLAGTQTITTFWMDVLEWQTYISKNNNWYAAKYGGFAVPSGFNPYAAGNGTSTLPLSAWYNSTDTLTDAAKGVSDKRPDNYFTAGDADGMRDGLTATFDNIIDSAGRNTSSAYAAASPNVTSSGTVSYSSSYEPANWTSSLTALQLTYDASDNVTTTTLWEAGALLDARTPASRFIVTSNGSTALEFTSASLSSSAASQYSTFSSVPGVASASQSSSNFLAYLRGDRSQEKSNGGVYRNRSHLLGDIVNSKLTIVAAPSSSYSEASNPGYFAFARSYKSRSTVVYAGANDGMMHAFNGSTSGSDAGKELFAYIPSFVYGTSTTAKTTGLASLGNSKFTHHYFVDSTPIVTDIDFDRSGSSSPSTGSPDWRSVLIGGLGKGGKGYFAIDVTDPSAWTSQTAVKNKVLWEFSASTMGYSYGNPIVVKTKRWGWVAILTSGYGSSDGKGYIYFVNPKTGALLESISTSSGSLSAPIDFAQLNAFIPDLADYTATELYVGDIQGNLWRVDVSGTGSYSAPLLFATLKDSSGTAQPITTAPRVMIDPSTSKRYVLVGTGRLLDDSDITNSQTQSFYAIIDGTSSAPYKTGTLPSGASFPVTRSQLTANTSPTSGIGSSPTGPMGWYIDLGTDATTGIAERISITPTVNKGIVGFAVNLPNGQVCNPSGSSYIMGLKYNTGQSVVTNASGTLLSKTPSSSKIVTDIAFNNVSGKLRLVAGFNDGSITSVSGSFNSSSSLLRLNWREVPTSQ